MAEGLSADSVLGQVGRQGARETTALETTEGDDASLREALSFLGPCLWQFRLMPSHVISTMSTQDMMLVPDQEHRQAIFHHERQKNFDAAVGEFLNWLLNASAATLAAFHHALLHDTDEHKRVYGLLVLCNLYLPLHHNLVTSLTHKLQEESFDILSLLDHLAKHQLLKPDLRKKLADVGIQWVNATQGNSLPQKAQDSEEVADEIEAQGISPEGAGEPRDGGADVPLAGPVTAEYISKFLLACLYYRQVEILTSGSVEVSEDRVCHRCPWEAQAIPTDLGYLWAHHVTLVFSALQNVSLPLPNDNQLQQLWAKVQDEIGTIFMEDAELRSENEHYQEAEAIGGYITQGDAAGDADHSSSSRCDSSDTLVLQGEPEKNINLDRVRKERTENYVKMHSKMAGLEDHDCSSEISVTTMSSDNNPSGNLSLRPRGGGVLQQQEMESLKTGEITLWPYQEELLVSARKGHNVLIWLPTGTGKTYLVLKYSKEHLQSAGGRRVVFVVPRVRLAQQQYERFKAFFNKLQQFKVHMRTGETTGTFSARRPWTQLLETCRIFVMTAECLVKAVENRHVTLSHFSLLVLDECHHCRGGHPLRNLMNLYMDMKYSNPADSVPLPQIIGLTASPGVGRSRGQVPEQALQYLCQLCARLDVREICSVRKKKEDLAKHVYEPKHEKHTCPKRKIDQFKEKIESLMETVEKWMYTHSDVERYTQCNPEGKKQLECELSPPSDHRGESIYTEWVHNLEKRLKGVDKKAFYVLMACADMLKLLQRALILNEDSESINALDFLMKEVEKQRAERPLTAHVDHRLLGLFDEEKPALKEYCLRKRNENPKLKLLKQIILNSTRKQELREDGQGVLDLNSGHFNTSAALLENQNSLTSDSGKDLVKHTQKIRFCKRAADNDHGPRNTQWQTKYSTTQLSLMGSEDQHSDRSETFVKQVFDSNSYHINDLTREDTQERAGSPGFSFHDSDSSFSDVESEIDWEMDDNIRGMIFVRTLDLSKALVDWIQRDPKLRILNPGRITGSSVSAKEGGMTPSELTDVMRNFNSGVHKLVVCTSAAEEGLDFTACNLVIRYDYVASMVSMIQTRGRARQKDSQYWVLGNEGSDSIAKEEANLASEVVMRDAVAALQKSMDRDPGAHLDNIARLQRQAYDRRWSQQIAEAMRDKNKLGPGFYRLLCRKCKHAACSSYHIRLLKRTNRVVIGRSFSHRYKRRDTKKKEAYDKDIDLTDKALHCKVCGQRWGIFVRSVTYDIEFPVITIKSFVVQDEMGGIHVKEKWSQAFDVPHLSDADCGRQDQPESLPQDDNAEAITDNAEEVISLERPQANNISVRTEEDFNRPTDSEGER